jgi:N-acylneuraminate cytidylyltransferase
MTVAIVPARGGSKRLPRKNVRPFLGRPLISYAIDAIDASRLFDRIVVSTDDEEIAEISRRCGAEVPFRRPPELADDHASTDAVLLHALAESERLFGASEYGCCVYANPFLTPHNLARGFEVLKSHGATSAFPVVKYDFPIEQAFVLDGARPRPRWPEKLAARSQDLAEHFHDAGMFYWFDVKKYRRARELFCDDCVAFPVAADDCQDINNESDWARAELKYRILRESAKN